MHTHFDHWSRNVSDNDTLTISWELRTQTTILKEFQCMFNLFGTKAWQMYEWKGNIIREILCEVFEKVKSILNKYYKSV